MTLAALFAADEEDGAEHEKDRENRPDSGVMLTTSLARTTASYSSGRPRQKVCRSGLRRSASGDTREDVEVDREDLYGVQDLG